MPKIVLFRVVETVRRSPGRLVQCRSIWQPTLVQALAGVTRMPRSPMTIRVHIEDSEGRMIKRIEV